ncbi:MAG: type II secretion system F family protein [Acidimicrobiia bacterium]|jgi:tight adherence protein C
MLSIGIVGVGLAIGLALYAVLESAEEKATVRASLRQLEDYEVESVRERELLAPLRDRAVAPIMTGLVGLGRRFTPQGYVDRTKAKLVTAGYADQAAVDRFLAIRVVTVVAAPIAAYLAYQYLPLSGIGRLMGVLLAAAVFVVGPDSVLDRKVQERQYEIRRKLPDVMDLLVISVEAGLGFEQALDRTIAAVPGPLTEEFSRMLGEVRAGASRADALRAMDARTDVPEIRSFVLAILQADTFGVSIGRVLRAQADEMRIKRRQLAQERAAKAPVKMLIPMVFCIFPALFVVVLGPAAMNIADAF